MNAFNIFKFLQLLCLVSATLLFESCNFGAYMPCSSPAHLYKEKGEFAYSLGPGVVDEGYVDHGDLGLQFFAGYAYDSSHAVSLRFHHLRVNSEDQSPWGKGHLLEASWGIFGRTFADDNLRGTLQAGLGYGHAQANVYSGYNRNYNASANIMKAFIQSDYGYSGKHLDIIFSPKLSLLKYNHINVSKGIWDNAHDLSIDNKLKLFFEPALTLRLGFQRFKLQAQCALLWQLAGVYMSQYDGYASLGLIININTAR